MEGKVMSSHSSVKFPASNDKKRVTILISVVIIGAIAILGIIFLRQRQTLTTPAQNVLQDEVCQAEGGVVFPGSSCPNGEKIIGRIQTIDGENVCCSTSEVELDEEEEKKEDEVKTFGDGDLEPTTSEQPSPTSSSPEPTQQDESVSPTTAPASQGSVTSSPSPSITDIVVVLTTNTPTPKSGIGGSSGSSNTPTARPTTSLISPSKTPTQSSNATVAPTKTSQSLPTKKPTLPASGLPQASFLILGLGILVMLLGLAL